MSEKTRQDMLEKSWSHISNPSHPMFGQLPFQLPICDGGLWAKFTVCLVFSDISSKELQSFNILKVWCLKSDMVMFVSLGTWGDETNMGQSLADFKLSNCLSNSISFNITIWILNKFIFLFLLHILPLHFSCIFPTCPSGKLEKYYITQQLRNFFPRSYNLWMKLWLLNPWSILNTPLYLNRLIVNVDLSCLRITWD